MRKFISKASLILSILIFIFSFFLSLFDYVNSPYKNYLFSDNSSYIGNVQKGILFSAFFLSLFLVFRGKNSEKLKKIYLVIGGLLFLNFLRMLIVSNNFNDGLLLIFTLPILTLFTSIYPGGTTWNTFLTQFIFINGGVFYYYSILYLISLASKKVTRRSALK